jgi:hypothetical protein
MLTTPLSRFLAATYKIDISSASNVHNLNNAIKRGSETGALVLPKGNSGRIKLAPKVRAPHAYSKSQKLTTYAEARCRQGERSPQEGCCC